MACAVTIHVLAILADALTHKHNLVGQACDLNVLPEDRLVFLRVFAGEVIALLGKLLYLYAHPLI